MDSHSKKVGGKPTDHSVRIALAMNDNLNLIQKKRVGYLIKCPVLELERGCSHPTVMNDLCAECGTDLRKEEQSAQCASVPMVHCIPDLKISEEQAQIIGKADEERLLKDRKLVLLVDLDQTLIHTTNDNIPNNLKDVYHFQLYGPKSPWYHTRFRPRTNQFLLAMSKFYELHICTFGARNYAHMIARFLDPDGKFFSHRILSRDECFNPNSKMANLKALFPCGDNMVCIIDDREDVWNFAPNLIHVKPYHFFSHTGDIHAPPGLSKCENDEKEGIDFTHFAEGTKVKSKAGKFKSKNGLNEKKKKEVNDSELEEGEIKSEDNTISESELETNEKSSISTKSITTPFAKPGLESDDVEDPTTDKPSIIPNRSIDENEKVEPTEEQMKSNEIENSTNDSADAKTVNENTIDAKTVEEDSKAKSSVVEKNELASSEASEEKSDKVETSVIDASSKSIGEADSTEDAATVEPVGKSNDLKQVGNSDSIGAVEKSVESKESKALDSSKDVQKVEPVDEKESKELKNGPDVTCSEERLKITEEDNLLEVEESDDYLLYLEDILKKVHAEFYSTYDSKKDADLKQIVPTLKEKVLAGTRLVFSGLVPTQAALEQSKAYYIAKSLGAEVTKELDKETTHLIAVRTGTAKVNAAKKMKHIKVVTPDWLWSCAERWERVEELLFPVSCEKTSSRHPPPHCVSPTHGLPAQRQRTPSGRFMDTINPLMSFSSEDIADMDAEVEDICNESESEGEERPAKRKKFQATFDQYESSSSSADSLSGENIRGWSKKRLKPDAPQIEEEESLNTRFRRGEDISSDVDLGEDSGASVGSEEPMDDISDGDWNMMGAALEREFLEGD
ncbi:hypothetical protein LSTR_LSTR000123 [Laodelphax striatellus]|uniref:RNA polymerase II subunit A C-terminal domain phosphatase n=1 Tax=Laodelphax striatellus TaxID=195883 RepID=A0A482X699_LAOST|nr:hypothetical protein LSTR_LSTR000123 [Laodelphax striatellus]